MEILNGYISSLSGIRRFEEKINPDYKKFRNEDISITIKSEMAVKGLYSNIIPYIHQAGDDNLYPTSGEGRKKLLTYAIFDILSEQSEEKKINIFLIEEPENHLHKSMQIMLSKILFTDTKYNYLFVSTHSPFILYEMNNVNLVRIFNKNKINSSSTFYKVPEDYENYREMLNRNLAEAIFADRVLLVEGVSELALFRKILTAIDPFYETEGGYILDIGGIGFEHYYRILQGLEIHTSIKTDNDLKQLKSGRIIVLGFRRCNNLIKKNLLPIAPAATNTIHAKRDLYSQNIEILDRIRRKRHIYLSKCDLENDLDEFLHDELVGYLKTEDAVEYLQEAKHYHMEELIKVISDEDCTKIYEHYNFACLKEVLV